MLAFRDGIEGRQDETRAPKSWSPGLLFGGLLLLVGCGGKGDPLAEAELTWAKAKSTCGTYTYTRFSSNFGEAHQTSVEITNDVPTRRRNTCNRDMAHTYDEQRAEVGTHGAGSPAKTVEELLDECEVIRTREEPGAFRNETEIGGRGVPTKCEAVFVGGASEGVYGVQITSFACEPFTSQPAASD